jgi:hypothetical protein
MKKLLKLLSVFVLLISSFAFAQYNPKGCIPVPKGLEDIIKDQIPQDDLLPGTQLRTAEMTKHIVDFNEQFNVYAKGGGTTPPKSVMDIIIYSQQTAYYEIPKSMIEKSSSLEGLRRDLRAALSRETNPELIQSYILLDYDIQIIQNSAYGEAFSRRGDVKCVLSIAVGTTLGSAVGSLGGPFGAFLGAAAGGALGAHLGCK